MTTGPVAPVVVLDTDVWSKLYMSRGRTDSRVANWRTAVLGMTVVISTQSRAEILYGAMASAWGDSRRANLESQLALTTAIPVNEQVIQSYATLRAACKASGHALQDKIHGCDNWIAATAIAIGAPLLTGDKVYRDAPGLTLLSPP